MDSLSWQIISFVRICSKRRPGKIKTDFEISAHSTAMLTYRWLRAQLRLLKPLLCLEVNKGRALCFVGKFRPVGFKCGLSMLHGRFSKAMPMVFRAWDYVFFAWNP